MDNKILTTKDYYMSPSILDQDELLGIKVIGQSADRVRVELNGLLLINNATFFKENIEKVHSENVGFKIELICRELKVIGPKAVYVVKELLGEGIELCFTDMNQDCYAALWEAGLEGIVEDHMQIPHFDVRDYHVIGKGANGRVYRVNDELILKTFKNDEPLIKILQERYLTRAAFQAGVPCPISFGLAEVDGKIALLMEMVKSRSLASIIREDETNIDTYAQRFVDLVRNLHNVKGEQLDAFPKRFRYKEMLGKADQLDEYMGEDYKGRLRKILEGIEGEDVLLHGDLQPCNIRVSEEGLSLIDMETLSTGPAILDVGALRRSLHCDWEFSDTDYSDFMKLTKQQLEKLWDRFIRIYYQDLNEEELAQKEFMAEIIGDTLTAAQFLKRGQMDQLHRVIDRLKELIQQADAVNS